MNSLLFILAFAALAVTQMLAGGRHLALLLPGCAILALAAVLSWWPKRREAIRGEAVECLAAGAFFFGYIAVRALFSPEEYLARKDLYVALGAMALYLLVALNLTSSKVRLWFVAGLLALGIANCGIGAVQFFKGQNFMLFDFLPRPDYGSRASGFYGYPNHLSGFLEIAALMGLSVAFWSRWPSWAKMVAGYTSLVCLLGILPTGSRGGYISVTIGLVVFGALSLVLIGKLASNRALGLIIAGALVIGGIGWGVHHLMSKSFLVQSRADETLTVDASRMRMWQAAWKQSRLHPIIGTGSGTYLYYGRLFRNPTIQADPIHAHDDYFELLAEYGIIGIIAMVVFLETHLRHGWTALNDSLSEKEESQSLGSNSVALTIGALSATAACLVHSFLDFNLHMPANTFAMALVFGLLANREPAEEEEASPESDLPAFLRLALPAVGLWIALRALPTFPAEYYAERAWGILADWKYITSPELASQLEGFARKGLEWDARNPELHSNLASALEAQAIQATDPARQQDLRAQEIEESRHAVEFASGDVRYILNLAEALDGDQRFAQSTPLFDHALLLDPNSGRVQLAYATHLQAIGNVADAAVHYQESIRLQGGASAVDGLEQLTAKLKKPGVLHPPAPPNPPPQ